MPMPHGLAWRSWVAMTMEEQIMDVETAWKVFEAAWLNHAVTFILF